MKQKMDDEKALERALCDRIDSGEPALKSILITTPAGTCTLLDLVGAARPTFLSATILEDTSDWNTHKDLSDDLFGLIVPDIVLRSRADGQNRIIIEVKKTSAFTHKQRHASQVLRYFLHLLVTTDRCPAKHCKADCSHDIRRAVLLAAPREWFGSKHADPWNWFVQDYGQLAAQFNITVGTILLP